MAQQNAAGWETPYKFTGKVVDTDRSVSKQDPETGLYYFGARYYDPHISLWMSVDPLAEKYPGWSPYNYVYNNPLKFVDPTGMEGESIHEDAYGTPIAYYNDGDNNVYRHYDLIANGQHIDGMKAYIDQKRERLGTSGGGEWQIGESLINKFLKLIEENKEPQQHQGDNMVIYWNGSGSGWSIVGDRPNSKGAKESIDMTKFILPNGPSNDILGLATFNDQVNQLVGNVKNGKDNTPAYQKYTGDPSRDPAYKLDSTTYQRNQTIKHYTPKNKK